MFKSHRTVYFALAVLCTWLAAPLLMAQKEETQPAFRATVEMVNILCTVQDHGRYVDDLNKADFDVYEDGVKQNITYFARETGADAQPLNVMMLVDTSGSVKDKLYFEKQAAMAFLEETLRKNKDMAAIIQFDSEIMLDQDFTFDLKLLDSALKDIRAGGATKLYDAIWLAVSDLLSDQVGRKVIVVLSDGDDTHSTYTDDDAIKIAQDHDVVIYGIGVRSGRFNANFGKLKEFARDTGGLFFNSKASLDELRSAFAKINAAVKNQYSLAYTPTNTARDGSFREITVKLRRSGLKVSHRKGYYAPKSDHGS